MTTALNGKQSPAAARVEETRAEVSVAIANTPISMRGMGTAGAYDARDKD
jgi:hypothetical protein